ncbi:MAG: cupin domain-containing protein [Rubrobacter sp.]
MKSSLIGHEFLLFGHRFRIVQSARQADDGALRIEYFAPPRATISEHVHPNQEESFEVVFGTLGVRVGSQGLILEPGESAVGPPGVPHAWWNPSEEEVCFLAGIRPGIEVEIMLETVLGLTREGKTIGPIPRNPLQLAVLAREVGSWAYSPGLPMPVRKALFAPVALLAFVGRLLGYRVHYPEYSCP